MKGGGGRDRAKTFNFSAGPATLPTEVLERASAELLNWRGSGMSVMEMSHRGKEFISILHQAEADLRELLDLPSNYKVLFLQGGATAQFAAIPLNMLANKDSADYLVTGNWSDKAFFEAKLYFKPNMVMSDLPKFTTVPERDTWFCNPDAAYFHYCDNETVHGIEFPADYFAQPENKVSVPLVADMSSNFCSRPFDITPYSVIYAGAQKNIGIAGLTVVIVREDVLSDEEGDSRKSERHLCPTILDWQLYADNESCLNTPSCYAIYMAGLCFRWLLDQAKKEEQGEGSSSSSSKKRSPLEWIGRRNERKSKRLYDFLDQSKLFRCRVQDKRYRSRMNVTFGFAHGADPELEALLVKEAEGRLLLGLKGYRTLGGFRASLYNAMTEEGVERLVAFLKEFEQKHALHKMLQKRKMRVVLGSSSVYRKAVLKEEMGFKEFVTMSPDIDEKSIRDDDPKKMVVKIANAKADALLPLLKEGALLITSDQVVMCNGEVREKPTNAEHCKSYLRSYAQHPAQTICGVVVTNTSTGKRYEGVDIAVQHFKPIPEEAIQKLIDIGDVMHCCGGFVVEQMEEWLGALEGEIESVRGLPKALTLRLLQQALSERSS
ncbi:Aminotransferase class V domain [Balamuthia mandrillaris]